MPWRDLILTAFILGALPFCLARPWVGVLFWSWLGFMSPHRLSWGFAYDMPFAQMVAAATLFGLLFTSDKRSVPAVRETALLVAFWMATLASSVFSLYPDLAWADFQRFSKILLMTFVMIMLSQTRERLRGLLMVAALSIGFYGFKGAVWSLLTGGEYGWVLGPEGSFIGDNNGLALGLNMVLPLLYFLAQEEPRRWLRWLLWSTFALTMVAVPFTYSRAGFLGLMVVLIALLARTRWKWRATALATLAIPVALSFLPSRYFDRIGTILTYSEDGSAMSRLTAWKVAWGIVVDHPVFGGGYRVIPNAEQWAKYAPEWNGHTVFNAHSTYFEVLGEHGFIGLLIFLALLGSTLLSMRAVRRQARRRTDMGWIVNYSYVVETALLVFLVSGAFYNLASFDLMYFLIGIGIVLKRLCSEGATVSSPSPAPRPSPLAVTRVVGPMARSQPLST